MPNWCSNTINISGDQETVKNLKAFVGRPISRVYADETQEIKEPVFSLFNIIAPTKDASPLMGLTVSEGDDDWYHNQINSWGTKWDVCGENVFFSESTGSLSYSFDSAWSPPEMAIARLAEIFPTLCIEHKYYEPGCDFWGIATYQNGVLFEEEGGELNHTAWTTLDEDCFNCQQYEEDPDEYEEYLYSDCPSMLTKEKKEGVSA